VRTQQPKPQVKAPHSAKPRPRDKSQAKVGPIVAAELKKAPNLTVDEVNKAVALALREAFAPDEAPDP
jgi:hypothetical protein